MAGTAFGRLEAVEQQLRKQDPVHCRVPGGSQEGRLWGRAWETTCSRYMLASSSWISSPTGSSCFISFASSAAAPDN